MRRVADDLRHERPGGVAAEVEGLAADAFGDVRRGHRVPVAGVDLPPLDRELRDALDRVVLPVGEPGRRPRLPVRRAEDERGDEREPDEREAADLRVHPGGAFARLETRRRPARRTKFATTLDPPYEMKGSVIPVSGMMRRIPPTMMNVWSAKPKVRPAAASFEKPSCARSAIRKPLATKSM